MTKPDIVLRIENVFRQNCMDTLAKMQEDVIQNLKDLEYDLFAATMIEKRLLTTQDEEIMQGHIKKEVANRLISEARVALAKSFYKAVENIKNIEID